MKRIVDGLLYDTKKAELLCKWKSNYDYVNCVLWHNYLYRTSSGRYFLYMRGMRSGCKSSEIIRPLTDDEACIKLAEYDPNKAFLFFPDKIKEA